MDKSRAQKASFNIASSLIYEIVAFVCGLILPRLILSNFGSEYNGITTSVTQFLNFISVLRLGVAGAIRVSLYKTLANGDSEGTSAIVNASEKYMRKIGYVLIAYIIILVIVYPFAAHTKLTFIEIAPLIVAAGIGAFAQYFFGITYSALLTADQSVYIQNFINIISTTINTLLAALLIFVGCNIQTVRLASSVIFLLNPLFLKLYAQKKYKINKKCTPDNTALALRRDALAHSIANIVHENVDVITLTLFCDVKLVSVYTIYNLVMQALSKILHIFSSGTEAIFGNMWALKETDNLRKSLCLYEFAIGVFLSIVFSAVFLLILPFVSLYTKGITDTEYILPIYAIIISLAQAFYCFRTPYLTLVQGVGHYKETKKGAFIEASLNLIISIVLVQFIGIIGVAVGTLVANIFRSFQYAFYIDRNLIMRSRTVIFKRLGWIVLNICMITATCFWFIKNIAYTSWLLWAASGVILVIVGAIITVITSIIFYRSDFRYCIKIASKMLSFKKKKRG